MLELELEIREMGFREDEIQAIENHFLCTLDYNDWETICFIKEEDYDEDAEDMLKLPTGRIAYFSDELVKKELMSQID